MNTELNNRLPAAVIFDMDGVLVDSEPLHAEAYVEVFGEIGINLPMDLYLRTSCSLGGTVRDLYTQLGGDETIWQSVAQRKADRFKSKLEADSKLQPGVVKLLEMLSTEHIPTALATSAGHRSLGIIMNRFGLTPYFSTLVTSNDVEV